MANVYLFDKPTIAYCRSCELIAYHALGEGFKCPRCGAGDSFMSTFVWDGESRYPLKNDPLEHSDLMEENRKGDEHG